MTKKQLPFYLELAARYHVALLLSLYGMGKIIGGQFYRRGNLPDSIAQIPLAEVGGFDLAWSFMGYSYAYILFVGISQLLGAFLLLFEKTKLFGVAILTPILVNIIVFDMIFFDRYGALASATIYFLLLVLIMYYNRDKLKRVIQIFMNSDLIYKKPTIKKVYVLGIVLLIMGLIFGVEQFFVNLLGH